MSADESVFARINREANEKREATVGCADNAWDESAWLDCGASSGGLRPTEDIVCRYNSGRANWRYVNMANQLPPDLKALLSGVWAEVKREIEAEEALLPVINPNHRLPLKDVMGKRGETIEWLDLGADNITGKKTVRAVVVKMNLGARKRR